MCMDVGPACISVYPLCILFVFSRKGHQNPWELEMVESFNMWVVVTGPWSSERVPSS